MATNSGAGVAGASPSGGGASAGASVGGERTGGASAGGESAGGASLVLGDSKTEACIAYALAVCRRQSECSGSTGGDCWSVSFDCPDLAFSPGATRTPAVLKACAEAYQKLPCEQIELGILPECVTPGTRAVDEPCSFSSQCASLACGGDDTCGKCVPSAHEGEACTEPASCLGYLTCLDGKCTRGTNAGGTPRAVGEDCSTANALYCQAGLYCDNATSKCVSYPAVGMSCAETRTCGADSYCALDELTCRAMPGKGAPCGVDGFTGRAAYCQAPLICSRTSNAVGTCVDVPEIGQPCIIDPENDTPVYGACVASARCDEAQAPPTCVAKASRGQSCTKPTDCAFGTTCMCPHGEASCDTAATICARIQLKGQPCTAAGDVCHPGFTCANGVCEPRESQGLFEGACNP